MRSEMLKSSGKLAVYFLLPLVFFLIPPSWLESRRSICLIRAVSGKRCPGCGMTRAVSCIVHGNFRKAVRHNPLVLLVFPLLCYTWLQAVRREYRQRALLSWLAR
jgi:hypothetical protein